MNGWVEWIDELMSRMSEWMNVLIDGFIIERWVNG